MLRRLADRAFEHPLVYRTLQAPFRERKLAPVLRRLRGHPEMRVLDVGCGPGTNAAHFCGMQYTGIDINPEYIANAQRRFPGRFLVGDVTNPSVLPAEQFDCVLLNSLMHHLDDASVDGLLGRLGRFLAARGAMHIETLEQYPLGLPGIPLWHMVYCAGRSR